MQLINYNCEECIANHNFSISFDLWKGPHLRTQHDDRTRSVIDRFLRKNATWKYSVHCL